MRRLIDWRIPCGAILLGLATTAAAWWNGEWPYRRAVDIDTSALELVEPVPAVNVPVRLHTGNFSFENAADDGSDLRFVAGDDSTPLPFYIERYDRENEIGLVWVQIPAPAGATSRQRVWVYYGNPQAEAGSAAASVHDLNTVVALHFSATEALPQDATALGNHALRSTIAVSPGGVIGDAARFEAESTVLLPRAPSLQVPAGGSLSITAWIRLAARGDGQVFSLRDGDRSLMLAVEGDTLYAQVDPGGGLPVAATERTPSLDLDRWYHVALTADSTTLAIHLDGRETARTAAPLPALAGDVALGASAGKPSFRGELDQVEIANVARGAGYLALVAGLGTPDTALVSYGEAAEGTGRNYLDVVRVIGRSVSPEGWVIVALIAVLGVISIEVMIRKLRLLGGISRADRRFLQRFDELPLEALAVRDVEALEALGEGSEQSALNHVFRAGLSELDKAAGLLAAKGLPLQFTPEVVEVLRSGIDGEIVRQSARMNREIVLLTLAVSAAPFLGLLGTVVGIMMTFGAITLVGDVNVNTIAPGVAAALITTVAGLAVAIPAMFGYNRVATTIREQTSAMDAFANELLARLALANLG